MESGRHHLHDVSAAAFSGIIVSTSLSAYKRRPSISSPSACRLCGYTPFRSDDPVKLAAETQRGKVEFHDRYWKNISQEAKEFVKACLTVSAPKRLTADEALEHPWLVEHEGKTAMAHDLSIGLRENYRKRWKVRLEISLLGVS